MRAYEPPQCSPLRLFWSDEASCGGFEWDGRSEAEHVEEMAINRGIDCWANVEDERKRVDRALSARDAAEGTGVNENRTQGETGLIEMTSAKSRGPRTINHALICQGVTITPRRLPMKVKG